MFNKYNSEKLLKNDISSNSNLLNSLNIPANDTSRIKLCLTMANIDGILYLNPDSITVEDEYNLIIKENLSLLLSPEDILELFLCEGENSFINYKEKLLRLSEQIDKTQNNINKNTYQHFRDGIGNSISSNVIYSDSEFILSIYSFKDSFNLENIRNILIPKGIDIPFDVFIYMFDNTKNLVSDSNYTISTTDKDLFIANLLKTYIRLNAFYLDCCKSQLIKISDFTTEPDTEVHVFLRLFYPRTIDECFSINNVKLTINKMLYQLNNISPFSVFNFLASEPKGVVLTDIDNTTPLDYRSIKIGGKEYITADLLEEILMKTPNVLMGDGYSNTINIEEIVLSNLGVELIDSEIIPSLNNTGVLDNWVYRNKETANKSCSVDLLFNRYIDKYNKHLLNIYGLIKG